MARLALGAALSSIILLGLRLDLSRVVSLGDSEALYLAFGLHPQATYLHHPGLIGWIAQLLGAGATPRAVHTLTAVGATLLPWAGVLAARACGSTFNAALRTYFALAFIPELSVGSFAFAPNLPFCFSWLAALGCAGLALRLPAGHIGTLLAWSSAGAAVAASCLSMTSGWLLFVSVLVACLVRPDRTRLLTLGPWTALGLFAILLSPVVASWFAFGINVRFDWTPVWGESLLTLARPIASITPPFLVAAVLVARTLSRRGGLGPVDRLLASSLLVPLIPQVLLALFAGDSLGDLGWLAPAYLTLALQAARIAPLPRHLSRSCVGLGAALVVASWAWLRTDMPLLVGQALGGYEPLHDASNDFYAWGPGRVLLEDAVEASQQRTGQLPVVVGPHWALCAQAEVALHGRVPVACDSAELDDYDRWAGAAAWSRASTLVFVTDSRFHADPPETFYGWTLVSVHEAPLERFGQEVRHISVSEFDREATAGR